MTTTENRDPIPLLQSIQDTLREIAENTAPQTSVANVTVSNLSGVDFPAIREWMETTLKTGSLGDAGSEVVDEAPKPPVPQDPLRYFSYSHLPEGQLRATSKLFHDLAETLVERLPQGAERSVALRKLLESKDAAVRAALDLAKG